MGDRRLDPQCVFAWVIAPLLSMALVIAAIIWASSLVGGMSSLMSILACGLASYWFFSKARREPLLTRIVGYALAVLLLLCAVTITGVLG